MNRELHILNLGAGVQSTTLYLMFMRGEIRPQIDAAIFADTQEEPQPVYRHLEWLKSLKGPPIITEATGPLGDDLIRGAVRRTETAERVANHASRFASIPAFTTDDDGKTVGQTKRQCSLDYKTRPLARVIRLRILELRPRQTVPKRFRPIHVNIGISFDEGGRARKIIKRFAQDQKWAMPHFPLLDRFMTRADCLTWLGKHFPGRDIPRSACVFCPYRSDAEWHHLKSEDPEGWERAVEVDYALRAEGSIATRQVMYLHRSCKPLDLVQLDTRPTARDLQMPMSFYQECEGVCGV